MKTWLRRISVALRMGLTWAVPWVCVAFLIEAFVDPHGRIADIWPAVLGLPAFLGGVFFSVVLGIAARGRTFDELSLPRFTAWGALAGLMVSALPFLLSTPAGGDWLRATLIIAPVTVLTAVSAAGSLALARRGERQESLPR